MKAAKFGAPLFAVGAALAVACGSFGADDEASSSSSSSSTSSGASGAAGDASNVSDVTVADSAPSDADAIPDQLADAPVDACDKANCPNGTCVGSVCVPKTPTCIVDEATCSSSLECCSKQCLGGQCVKP